MNYLTVYLTLFKAVEGRIFVHYFRMIFYVFRFGDTSLQEKINFDNYGILYRYIEKYQVKIGDPGIYC